LYEINRLAAASRPLLGHGGIRAVAQVAGVSETTVRRGVSELKGGAEPLCDREDASQAHTRSGPGILASLRNLAIGALRLAGRHDITEATRWANRYMNRPFTILGLTL
jgi:hypothetical protein